MGDHGDENPLRPSEIWTPAGGEALSDDEHVNAQDDHKEPTEMQKRELFKIHRALGHPNPNDMARALKHAGVKRHLIRWAAKELRCPVCEIALHGTRHR